MIKKIQDLLIIFTLMGCAQETSKVEINDDLSESESSTEEPTDPEPSADTGSPAEPETGVDTGEIPDTDTGTNTDSGEEPDSGEEESQQSDTQLDLGNGIVLSTVVIPAGSDPLQRYNITTDYHLMTTEVTQGMFFALMGYQAYDGESSAHGNGTDYPAYYVSWHMGASLANAATVFYNSVHGTSLNLCYTCNGNATSVMCTETMSPAECTGYRYATEAEWEYAARSGSTGDFWTGDGPDLGGNYSIDDCTTPVTIQDGVSNPSFGDYAWYCGNSNGTTCQAVGQKLPNGFGLYDMHGNLWEWTADKGHFTEGCDYPASDVDPYCLMGSNRVMRGGYWNKRPDFLTSSYRISGSPTSRNKYIGTRLARSTRENTNGNNGNSSNGSSGNQICNETCNWSGDGACDDGGIGSSYDVCSFGSDCQDCGARNICEDTCSSANDSICDDDELGGTGNCDRGTDCQDCGSY